MIEKARAAISASPSAEKIAAPVSAISRVAPECPQCGDTMVKRVIKKGANSGSIFWGCTGFPKCRGTRAV